MHRSVQVPANEEFRKSLICLGVFFGVDGAAEGFSEFVEVLSPQAVTSC